MQCGPGLSMTREKNINKEKHMWRAHNHHLMVCPFLHLVKMYSAFALHGQALKGLTD